jgi:DNA modification methylase
VSSNLAGCASFPRVSAVEARSNRDNRGRTDPESANPAGEIAGENVLPAFQARRTDRLLPGADLLGGSSDGRTADSDSASLGSNPSPPATAKPLISWGFDPPSGADTANIAEPDAAQKPAQCNTPFAARSRTGLLPGAGLHQGDAIEVIRATIADSTIDLVYLDPPFLTQKDWTGTAGSFSDRWHWSDEAAAQAADLAKAAPIAAQLITGFWGRSGAAAYYVAMALLFVELRRVLRLTGSIWVHADDTAIHGLRIMLDVVFGPELMLGVVIWKRSAAHNTTAGFGRVHDTIACSARSRATRWRLWRIAKARPAPDRGDLDGHFVGGDPFTHFFVDGFSDDQLSSSSAERVGYPTQKPVALLERIILAATLRGDTVLDPTCGSGTTLFAAVKHGRRAIGIDRSAEAIAAATSRLSLDTRKLKSKQRQPRADQSQGELL